MFFSNPGHWHSNPQAASPLNSTPPPLCPLTSETDSISSSYTSHPYSSLGHPSLNGSTPSATSLTPIYNDFDTYFATSGQDFFEDDITASGDFLASSSMGWPPIDNFLSSIDPSTSLALVNYPVAEYVGAEALATPSLQWPNQYNGFTNSTYNLSAVAPPPPSVTFTNMQNIGHPVTPFRRSQLSQDVRDALSSQFGDILTGREVGVYQCTISDKEVWLVLEGNGERALPIASSEPLTRTPTHNHANNTPVLQGPYHCCRRMQKSELSGPLPSESDTDAYLYHELGVAPGTTISLALNEQLRFSEVSSAAISAPWKSVRVACLLAIRGSQRRALTTKGIFEALIEAVPSCAENSHLVQDRVPGGKRKGWPATVVSVLSTHTIFVQKTPEGRSCKEWRLDVRGEKYQVKLCAHKKARLNS